MRKKILRLIHVQHIKNQEIYGNDGKSDENRDNRIHGSKVA